MIGAVVLAAGASSRFGSPKQALLLGEVVPRVRESGAIGDLVVVLGAHEVPTHARTVRCADWADGPGASLRAGLATLDPACDAAIVVRADGPDIAPAAIDRVAAAWHADPASGDALAASNGGVRGHPVLLPRSLWAAIPDAGARTLTPRLIPCDDLGDPGDVDTPEQLPPRLRPR